MQTLAISNDIFVDPSRARLELVLLVIYDAEDTGKMNNEVLRNWAERIGNTLEWQTGPFVTNIRTLAYTNLSIPIQEIVSSVDGSIHQLVATENFLMSCHGKIHSFFQNDATNIQEKKESWRMLAVILDDADNGLLCEPLPIHLTSNHDYVMKWGKETAMSLLPFWSDRYRISIQFEAPSAASLEVFWAHGRGNAYLFHVGTISAEQGIASLRQYTRAGHCFLFVPTSAFTQVGSPTGSILFDKREFSAVSFPWSHVCAMFLVPAIVSPVEYNTPVEVHSQGGWKLMHEHHRDTWIWSVEVNGSQPLSNEIQSSEVHLLQGEFGGYKRLIQLFQKDVVYHTVAYSGSQYVFPSELLRSLIFYYWQRQRDCQIALNSWVLPSLTENNPVSNDNEAQRGEQDNGPSPLEDVAIESKNQLYKVVSLPTTLRTALKQAFLRTYYSQGSRSNRRASESMISMVFNQDVSPTFYSPLTLASSVEYDENGNNRGEMEEGSDDGTKSVLWEWLEETIVNEIRNWSPFASSWEITGRYACREYRASAVVRWHVDPVEFQPITAIVHIAHRQYRNLSDNNHSRGAIDGSSRDNTDRRNTSWTLQVPRIVTGLASALASTSPNLEDIELQEGDVLLLQSAKLPHARIHPLSTQIEFYANAFLHVRPTDWERRREVQCLREQ